MSPDIFSQLTASAHEYLLKHHLRDALYLIKMLLKDLQLSEAQDACQQLEDNYSRMLQFISQGGNDGESETLRGNMLEEAHKLLTKAEQAYRLQNEKGLYVDTWKQLQESHENLDITAHRLCSEKPHSKARETLLDHIFYMLWTSAPLDTDELAVVEELMANTDETEQCMIISALGLSLLEYPDSQKMLLLAKAFQHPVKSVRVRAVMGIACYALAHPDETTSYSKAYQMIREALQQEEVQEIITQLNMAFLICTQTENAMKKLEKDIMPSFLKLAKNGHVDLGFDQDGQLDVNLPEDMQEDSKASRQLRSNMNKFIEMHRDGIDMNASNMVALRSLPFFWALPHWFLPFDRKRTEVKNTWPRENGSSSLMMMIGSMMNSGGCDTDLYGFLMVIPEIMKKANFKQQMEDLSQSLEGDGEEDAHSKILEHFLEITNRPSSIKDLCRKYMQQLYRVFTKSAHSSEWQNPFQNSANWLSNPLLGSAISHNTKALHLLADYLIKYDNYSEAEAYLNRLVQLEGSDAETLRQAAYCKQQQEHYASALNLYTQADILQPSHHWTLSQMQYCYAQLDKPEQRLDCLEQLLELDPENTKIITGKGLCLIKLERWQDALQCFFRMELESKDVIPSQRAIAWCSLNLGKNEQALKYYKRVLDTPNARWQDYLNAGHATWMLGDTAGAVAYYMGYIKNYLTDDPKITDALSPFNEDYPLLLALGKSKHEIDTMYDIIQLGIKD